MNGDELHLFLYQKEVEWEEKYASSYPRLQFMGEELAIALAAERDALRDVIAYMAGLHYETDGVCAECGKPWVCDTRARAASVEYPAETGREQ